MATTVKFNNNSEERGTKYYNWDKWIFSSVKKQIAAFESEEIKPAVRGILYVLESTDDLKKTDYNGLSKHLVVEWRENGDLPVDCVADKTRHIIDIHQFEPKSNWAPDFDEDYPGLAFYFRFENACIHVDFNERLQTWDEIVTAQQ